MSEQPILRAMVMVQQPIFRQGIVAILKEMAGCDIMGLPTNMSEALELARTREPEVALLDTFSTIDMLEIARLMRTTSPTTAVILLSEQRNEEWLFQAVKVGAAAYSTRNITSEALVEVIRKVGQGEYVINDEVLSQPSLASRVFQSFREMTTDAEEEVRVLKPCPLSNRELENLGTYRAWPENKEIAKQLGISD